MLNINRALEPNRLLRFLSGLNRKAFDELCTVFDVADQEWRQRNPQPRQRARGGGRKARLPSAQAKRFCILLSFKC